MDFIKVTINNTIGGTYTAFAEEPYPPYKRGDAICVLSAKQVQAAENLAIKQCSLSKYLIKPKKYSDKAMIRIAKCMDTVINWLDGKISINDLTTKYKPLKKIVSVKQEDEMFWQKKDKLIYSLMLSDGNVLKNVDKSIFDYFKVPIEFNKIRYI